MGNEPNTTPDEDVRFFIHAQAGRIYCYGNRYAFCLSENMLVLAKQAIEFAYCDDWAFMHPSWFFKGYFYALLDYQLFRCSRMSIERVCPVLAADYSLFVSDGKLMARTDTGYLLFDGYKSCFKDYFPTQDFIPFGARLFPVFGDIIAFADQALFYIQDGVLQYQHFFSWPAMFAGCGLYVDSCGNLVDVLSNAEYQPTLECEQSMLRFYYSCDDFGLLPDPVYARTFWQGFDFQAHLRLRARHARLYVAAYSHKQHYPEDISL